MDLPDDIDIPRAPIRRRWALELTERTLKSIAGCAQIRLTVREASACLGVSADTFLEFLDKHPEAKQVWEDNKQVGRAKLRRILWRQAERDPAQARFLAKDTRWLSMDEGKDRITEPQQVTNVNILNLAPEDRIRRIQELQAKVINVEPVHQAVKPGRIGPPRA